MFFIDNIATVLALERGYSRDPWATTIRAARVVAAGIGCSLYDKWVRRRSCRGAVVADDLTHNLLTELSEEEVEAYLDLGQVSFPDPLLQWMSTPRPDQGLGRRCLVWLRNQYPGLKFLRPS